MVDEPLARQLSYNVEHNLPRPRWRWQKPDGRLDMPALVAEFLKWWRNNAAIVEQHADKGYLEAVPQLAFMGFLQRVDTGGGTVSREFAPGRGAIDLLVEYAGERHVIERATPGSSASLPNTVRSRPSERTESSNSPATSTAWA